MLRTALAREGYDDVDVRFNTALAADVAPVAPGMKYRHYAPAAPMTIVQTANPLPDLLALARTHIAAGRRVALLVYDEDAAAVDAFARESSAVHVIGVGSRRSPPSVAHALFDALRAADRIAPSVDAVLVTAMTATNASDGELIAAVMNRMIKAADGRIMTDETTANR